MNIVHMPAVWPSGPLRFPTFTRSHSKFHHFSDIPGDLFPADQGPPSAGERCLGLEGPEGAAARRALGPGQVPAPGGAGLAGPDARAAEGPLASWPLPKGMVMQLDEMRGAPLRVSHGSGIWIPPTPPANFLQSYSNLFACLLKKPKRVLPGSPTHFGSNHFHALRASNPPACRPSAPVQVPGAVCGCVDLGALKEKEAKPQALLERRAQTRASRCPEGGAGEEGGWGEGGVGGGGRGLRLVHVYFLGREW